MNELAHLKARMTELERKVEVMIKVINKLDEKESNRQSKERGSKGDQAPA